MSLRGHKALITGAGQGIGRACAEVFASRGADLVLLDKNAETLNYVADRVAEWGSKLRLVPWILLTWIDLNRKWLVFRRLAL